MAGTKRSRESYGSKPSGPKPNYKHQQNPKPKPKTVVPDGPFIPMFLTFREELDEHHDRRERVIKTSRDITALSKKMIFTLQRCGTNVDSVKGELYGYESQIRELIKGVAPDLQGLDGYRYSRQITGGLQEYVEAISFRCYLKEGRLIGLEECRGFIDGTRELEAPEEEKGSDEMEVDAQEGEKDAGEEEKGSSKSTKKHSGDSPSAAVALDDKMDTTTEPAQTISLTSDDFILGLFDLTGEMMRFAITNIGQTRITPTNVAEKPVLTHLRLIRAGFESLDTSRNPLGRDIDKKMGVMKQCVEKVEVAMYGMVVRGSERPEGWVMTEEDTGWGGGGGGGDYDEGRY